MAPCIALPLPQTSRQAHRRHARPRLSPGIAQALRTELQYRHAEYEIDRVGSAKGDHRLAILNLGTTLRLEPNREATALGLFP